MPTERDLENAMPKRQQYIYLIEDCVGPEDMCDPKRKHIVDAVIHRFYAEAVNNLDVDFHLQRVRYSDVFTWRFEPIATFASDIAIDTESFLSLSPHEESVWKELSDFLYKVGRNNRISGLTMLLPIFVFFTDDCSNIENAIDGGRDLANNRYYAASKAANRRIVFCCDNIWDIKDNALDKNLSISMDFVFPYRLFNGEVLNHFLLAQGRGYMSGELYSELLSLHENGTLQADRHGVPYWADDSAYICKDN